MKEQPINADAGSKTGHEGASAKGGHLDGLEHGEMVDTEVCSGQLHPDGYVDSQQTPELVINLDFPDAEMKRDTQNGVDDRRILGVYGTQESVDNVLCVPHIDGWLSQGLGIGRNAFAAGTFRPFIKMIGEAMQLASCAEQNPIRPLSIMPIAGAYLLRYVPISSFSPHFLADPLVL